jgi:bacterioferritin (cytochrome b1)
VEAASERDLRIAREVGSRLRDSIRLALKVRDRTIRDLLVALLAEGHILIEDHGRSGPSSRACSAPPTCCLRT